MIGIMVFMEVLFALGIIALPVVWFILLIMKKNRKHIGKAIIICFIGFIINGIAIGEFGETKEKTNVVAPVEESQTPAIETYEGKTFVWSELTAYPWGKIVNKTLENIGVTNVTSVICETASFGNVTLKIATDKFPLWVSVDEDVDNEWSVEWVRDYEETLKYYYTAFDWEHIDLYSYETGKLIKEASEGSSMSKPYILTAQELVAEINSNTDAAKVKYNGKWVQITGKVLGTHNVAGMTNFYLHGEKGGSGLKIVCWVNKEVPKPFDYKGETHTFLGKMREVTTVNATEIGDCEIVE